MQRPSAKELMRHPFIKKAKKNSYLMDLIDRHRKWKITRGEESDSDSGGESGGEAAEEEDTDWIMTVKGNPLEATTTTQPPSYDSLGYSQPVNSVPSDKVGAIFSMKLHLRFFRNVRQTYLIFKATHSDTFQG